MKFYEKYSQIRKSLQGRDSIINLFLFGNVINVMYIFSEIKEINTVLIVPTVIFVLKHTF